MYFATGFIQTHFNWPKPLEIQLSMLQEFQHQYIFGESGLEPKVRVRDTDKHLTAFWKPTNFLKWLSLLRDYEPVSYFISVNCTTHFITFI